MCRELKIEGEIKRVIEAHYMGMEIQSCKKHERLQSRGISKDRQDQGRYNTRQYGVRDSSRNRNYGRLSYEGGSKQ